MNIYKNNNVIKQITKKQRSSEKMVECYLEDNVIVRVPKKIFDQVVIRTQLPEREYINYREGAVLYGMSERRFHDLVKDAEAKIQYGGKILVSVKAVNAFLESCKVE